MPIHKVTEVFVGNGSAMDANNTSVSALASQIAIVGSDMTALNPAGVDTISTQPAIYLMNKYTDGTFKKSMKINGTNVTKVEAAHYKPARPEVWGVGHQRGSVVDGTTVAAGGTITAANSTVYNMNILFTNDKTWYSERPERLSISFTSAAAATQLTIATQIAAAINNSAFGPTPTAGSGANAQIKAVVVGDGTGVYGLTGATDYGVEIWGLAVPQFQTSTYRENIVSFQVFVDDSSGFGTGTTCVRMQSASQGTGTYNQVYNMENFCYQYEGVQNRRQWPIPSLTYLASSTYVTSANVAAAFTSPTGNISAGTISEDTITVTATTGLRPGEVIAINDVQYVIKYIASATVVVLTTVLAATYTGASLKVKYLYNVINIQVADSVFGAGANQVATTFKDFFIFTPAIDAAAADPFDRTYDSADTSAEALDLRDIIGVWMTSTPLAPAVIAYT